jgi:cytidine deaminase
MAANKLQLVVSADVFENEKQLAPEDLSLLKKAEESMHLAYAPYSQFKVGAALLLDSGKLITGNNQENAAYPSGLCAERVALFAAFSQYPQASVKTLAVVCDSRTDEPVSPCGACRQVMAEYEQKSGKKMRLIMGSPGGKIYIFSSAEALLPFSFGSKFLKR